MFTGLFIKDQTEETIQMSINKRMDKQIMAGTYSGIILSKKTQTQNQKTHATRLNLKMHYAKQKKLYALKSTNCMILFV